ncbi:unnamed protein product [Closterium sp. NIES-54]
MCGGRGLPPWEGGGTGVAHLSPVQVAHLSPVKGTSETHKSARVEKPEAHVGKSEAQFPTSAPLPPLSPCEGLRLALEQKGDTPSAQFPPGAPLPPLSPCAGKLPPYERSPS